MRRVIRVLALLLAIGGTVVALVGAVETLNQKPPLPPASGPTQRDAAAFLDQLASAIRAGDAETLYQDLHPGIIAAYGEPACRAAVASVKDPTAAFQVVSVRGPGVWLWSADGHAFLAATAFELSTRRTSNGSTGLTTTHVAYVAGRWRFFTRC